MEYTMEFFAAQLNFSVGDLHGNQKKIEKALQEAKNQGAAGVVFSEMGLTGYPPEDLLRDRAFLRAAAGALEAICPFTKGLFVAIGLPRLEGEDLFNSAAICIDGKLAGFYDKQLLPTYNVFDEKRYFKPGNGNSSVWEYRGKWIGVSICEDAWYKRPFLPEHVTYCTDPLEKMGRVDLLINLSASPYYEEKRKERLEVFRHAALRLKAPVLVCNQVGANDALIFDGASFALSQEGEVIAQAKSFEEELLGKSRAACLSEVEELYHALVLGVRDYFYKQGFQKAVLGLSGGIDSAVVAAIGVEALGHEHLKVLALPSRYSSLEARKDAQEVAHRLQISYTEVSIDPLLDLYTQTLRPQFSGELMPLTEENLQARIRGMLLMAHANQEGALLLNTSNKSEAAMGYTTLYGDLCGGLAVLLDVPKTRVYDLARFLAETKGIFPETILAREPSAELRPGQKDTDSLPPYSELDPMLEEIVSDSFDTEEFLEKRGERGKNILRQLLLSEYKRKQAPLGLCVTKKSFAKGRVVPIVHRWRI